MEKVYNRSSGIGTSVLLRRHFCVLGVRSSLHTPDNTIHSADSAIFMTGHCWSQPSFCSVATRAVGFLLWMLEPAHQLETDFIFGILLTFYDI